jgi:hypothetical protein
MLETRGACTSREKARLHECDGNRLLIDVLTDGPTVLALFKHDDLTWSIQAILAYLVTCPLSLGHLPR